MASDVREAAGAGWWIVRKLFWFLLISEALVYALGHDQFLTVLVLVALAIYFIPSMIAISRKHRQAPAIFALNLLMGFTAVGWVAAFVWAMIRERKEAT